MTTKEQVMLEVWELYRQYSPNITLGKCIRQACSQFQSKQHNCLSGMDGNVALGYFETHFSEDAEQQLNLLGE